MAGRSNYLAAPEKQAEIRMEFLSELGLATTDYTRLIESGPDHPIWDDIAPDMQNVRELLAAAMEEKECQVISNNAARFVRDARKKLKQAWDAINVIGQAYMVYDRSMKTKVQKDIPYSNPYLRAYYQRVSNVKIDKYCQRILVNDVGLLAEMITELVHTTDKGIACDIETTGLDPYREDLVGLSFAHVFDSGVGPRMCRAFYLPCGHVTEDNGPLFGRPKRVAEQLTQEQILWAVQLLIDNEIPLIFHNAAFDAKWLIHLGIKFPEGYEFHDTLLLLKCYDERPRSGLKETAMRNHQYAMTKFEDVTSDKKFQNVGLKAATDYGTTDVIMTRVIWKDMISKIGQVAPQCLNVYRYVEMPVVVPIAYMELAGCEANPEHFRVLSGKLNLYINSVVAKIINNPDVKDFITVKALKDVLKGAQELEDKRQELLDKGELDSADEEVKTLFNAGSSQDISELLYEHMKLPVLKRTKNQAPSTSKKALKMLAKEHEVVRDILDYRTAEKLRNSYVDKMESFINPITGKVHPQTRQMGARSSRMSQTGGLSLQTLPRGLEDHPDWDIRRGFIAGANGVITESDYCQMELVMIAALSQEPLMLEAFAYHREMMLMLLSGVSKKDPKVQELKFKSDLHYITAAAALEKDIHEVTKVERDTLGKTMNFLVVYGGTEVGLADLLTTRGHPTSEQVAKKYLDAYKEKYRVLAKFIDSRYSWIAKNNCAVHACGRVVHNPFYGNMTGGAIRTLFNSEDQGECARRFKEAMAKLHWAYHRELGYGDVKIINLVHDAIYSSMVNDRNVIKRALELQRECMEFEFRGVYFSVEQAVKTSMSKADEIKIPDLIVV